MSTRGYLPGVPMLLGGMALLAGCGMQDLGGVRTSLRNALFPAEALALKPPPELAGHIAGDALVLADKRLSLCYPFATGSELRDFLPRPFASSVLQQPAKWTIDGGLLMGAPGSELVSLHSWSGDLVVSWTSVLAKGDTAMVGCGVQGTHWCAAGQKNSSLLIIEDGKVIASAKDVLAVPQGQRHCMALSVCGAAASLSCDDLPPLTAVLSRPVEGRLFLSCWASIAAFDNLRIVGTLQDPGR